MFCLNCKYFLLIFFKKVIDISLKEVYDKNVVTIVTERGDYMAKDYSILRMLMAKHRLTQNRLAEISGLSLPSISKKFTQGEEFKITPAYKILKYFREKGEKISFEDLFCAEMVTKVTDNNLLKESGD